MGFQESVPAWLFHNPVVDCTTNIAKFAARQLNGGIQAVIGPLAPKPPPTPQVVYMEQLPLWKLASSSCYFIRLAGLSGAFAVALGAYGAHAKFPKEEDEKLKLMFETANKYHFIHTLALLAAPLCHHPKLTGSLLSLGMVMFCGTCYYRALTGNGNLRRITPIGGTLLIAAWLSMVF